MGWYWWHSGRAAEGHRWLEEALACRSPATPAVHARALAWAAFIALQVDDRGVASRHAVQAIELGQQIADHTSLGLAWLVRARVALTEGRADLAVTFLDRGQQADEAAGDRWHHGIAAMLRAIGAMLRERPDVAARESVFAIDDFRAVGDVCTLVPMLHEYSRTLESSGEIVAAEAAATEASELSETFGLHGWQSTINCRLGELALRRGDTEISADHYRSAINLAQRLALATTEAIARDGLELATSAMR
jgi:tetratricopeptide (TPR) repeat protein